MGELIGVSMSEMANLENDVIDGSEVIDNQADVIDTEEMSGEQNSTDDQGDSGDDVDGEGADDVIVSIGDEQPPTEEQDHAPGAIRSLRRAFREKARQVRELEARLSQTQTTETKPVEVGAKPKLEDCDYDADRFERELANWFERKRIADAELEKVRQVQQAQQRAWQEKLQGYGKAKAGMRVRDFEDAEATAQELFNVTQQGVILQGADNPALVIYALGKNPKKAAELAKIADPVRFSFAVAKLETELKVTNRKSAPAPERSINSTGRVSGAVDSTLERLRAEAERTGNYTKVIQYKKSKQASKK